jgi:hypothetical protein
MTGQPDNQPMDATDRAVCAVVAFPIGCVIASVFAYPAQLPDPIFVLLIVAAWMGSYLYLTRKP